MHIKFASHLTHIDLIIQYNLTRRTNHEALHCAIFSSLHLVPLSWTQISLSALYSVTPSSLCSSLNVTGPHKNMQHYSSDCFHLNILNRTRVEKIYALLGYYATLSASYLLTFRDILSVF
jgi:hypothetical protein